MAAMYDTGGNPQREWPPGVTPIQEGPGSDQIRAGLSAAQHQQPQVQPGQHYADPAAEYIPQPQNHDVGSVSAYDAQPVQTALTTDADELLANSFFQTRGFAPARRKSFLDTFRRGAIERAEAAQQRAALEAEVKNVLPAPLTVAVISPKGGAGKTPTTIGLAAAMSATRGGGVVAWDNNSLRGTMLERLGVQDNYQRLAHMMEYRDFFVSTEANMLHMEQALNYQPDSFLRALGSDQKLTASLKPGDLDDLHGVLSRWFPTVVIDTGNDETAIAWQKSVEWADTLVVPVKWRQDSITPAARMVYELQERNPGIHRRTVIVGTNGPGEAEPKAREQAQQWFRDFQILEIPPDPALLTGPIFWSKMRDATQRAYLLLAATVLTKIRHNPTN